MAIKNWSTTASANNASPPDGWPEGMAPSGVNDAARKMMADIRSWYQDPEWIDFGWTVAQASTTSFTVTGVDATAYFSVGRRVKLVGGTTVYGVVSAVSFSTNTTVTVTLDSGTVPADLSAAYYSNTTPLSVVTPSVTWGGITGTLSSQSDLNTALNGKQATITGGATTITSSNLTASRALASDGSGKVAASTVTATELGHVSGVTSAIQTQLNGKAASSHNHAASDISSGTIATARLGSGTADSTTYLRGDQTWATVEGAGAPSWGSITGTLSNQTDLQTALNGKAASSHTHAASDVTSGTFSTARLGSGTANSSVFLRGDGTWAAPSAASISWGSITGSIGSQTDLQTALNAKQATITGAATSITGSNLTTSRALVSDASGKVSVSSVTSTQLGYVSGATSNLQSQINGKEGTLADNRKRQIFVQSSTPSGATTGDLWVW